MAANKDPQVAIMEEARDALDNEELPDKVGFKMLFSGLIAIHGAQKETNGQVQKNKSAVKWIIAVLGGAGTIVLLFAGEVVSLLFR